MKPTTQVRMLELRNLLQQISSISYSYAKISKEYPFDFMTEEQAVEVEAAYMALLEQAVELAHNFNIKYGKRGSNDLG